MIILSRVMLNAFSIVHFKNFAHANNIYKISWANNNLPEIHSENRAKKTRNSEVIMIQKPNMTLKWKASLSCDKYVTDEFSVRHTIPKGSLHFKVLMQIHSCSRCLYLQDQYLLFSTWCSDKCRNIIHHLLFHYLCKRFDTRWPIPIFFISSHVSDTVKIIFLHNLHHVIMRSN